MIVYSSIFNSYSNNHIIKSLRNNKWFWRHKFFFDHLSKKQYLILLKSLLIRSHPIAFVQLEGVGHHWYYKRPTDLADINFGYREGKNTIYWNQFLDDIATSRHIDPKIDFKKKDRSKLIPKVCFVSSNPKKIFSLQQNYPDFYRNLDIYGEFHMPIGNKLNLTTSRHIESLKITSQYIASLCIDNYEEEGYMQGSVLWSLSSATPAILKSTSTIKNFINSKFYINFDDYLKMTSKQKIIEINKQQELLCSNQDYLTNLTKDYICFFNEFFSNEDEPDLGKIFLKTKSFRKNFLQV